MGALDGAKLAGRLVVRNPLLPAAAAGIALAATALRLLTAIPLAGFFVGGLAGLVYFFVEPYLAGGFLGAVDEAIDGELTRSTFRERADEHYADLLVGRLALAIPLVGYLLVSWFGSQLTATLLGRAMDLQRVDTTTGVLGESPAELLAGVDPVVVAAAGVGVVVLACAAVAFTFLQFYPAAVVVGGAEGLDSFRYSYRLVREYPVPALGYTALTALAGVALWLPTLVQVLFVGALEPSMGEPATSSSAVLSMLATGIASFVVGLVLFLLVKTAVVAVVRTYHVAFVRTTLGTA